MSWSHGQRGMTLVCSHSKTGITLFFGVMVREGLHCFYGVIIREKRKDRESR